MNARQGSSPAKYERMSTHTLLAKWRRRRRRRSTIYSLQLNVISYEAGGRRKFLRKVQNVAKSGKIIDRDVVAEQQMTNVTGGEEACVFCHHLQNINRYIQI